MTFAKGRAICVGEGTTEVCLSMQGWVYCDEMVQPMNKSRTPPPPTPVRGGRWGSFWDKNLKLHT